MDQGKDDQYYSQFQDQGAIESYQGDRDLEKSSTPKAKNKFPSTPHEAPDNKRYSQTLVFFGLTMVLIGVTTSSVFASYEPSNTWSVIIGNLLLILAGVIALVAASKQGVATAKMFWYAVRIYIYFTIMMAAINIIFVQTSQCINSCTLVGTCDIGPYDPPDASPDTPSCGHHLALTMMLAAAGICLPGFLLCMGCPIFATYYVRHEEDKRNDHPEFDSLLQR